MKSEKYKYLEEEFISLQYGVAGIVENKREKFEPVYRKCTVIGVVICIISVIPLLFAGVINASDLYLLCLYFIIHDFRFTVVSISIVARISTPTIDATNIPPLRIKLSRYDDIDTLSRNLSIIKFRISVDALLLFPSEIFLTLSFNCLDELITLTPPRTSSLHLEFP